MPVSDAQKKASVRYLEKLDEVRIRMPKGKKATIQAHAEAQGQSVNAYINAAIDEKISQEAVEGHRTAFSAGVVSLPSNTLKAAQEAAEAAGEAVPVFVARAVETQAQRDALSCRMEGGKANE